MSETNLVIRLDVRILLGMIRGKVDLDDGTEQT